MADATLAGWELLIACSRAVENVDGDGWAGLGCHGWTDGMIPAHHVLQTRMGMVGRQKEARGIEVVAIMPVLINIDAEHVRRC